MARVTNNAVSGLVGTVVMYKWRGKTYMRAAPGPKSKRTVKAHRTPAQARSLARFGFASKMARRFADLFELSFEQEPGQLGRAQAIRYMLRGNAIRGEAPNFEVDFSQLLVSKGPVRAATGVSGKRDKSGNLVVSWADNSNEVGAHHYDKALLVMFDEESEYVVFKKDCASRSSMKASWEIPRSFKKVHTWITFTRDDGKMADSVYCGRV